MISIWTLANCLTRIVSIVACWTFFCVWPLCAQPIINVDFEPGPDGKVAYPKGVRLSGHTKVVSSDAHKGKHCLRIDVVKGGGGVAIPLGIEKGKIYHIAFYYKLSYPADADVFKICQSKQAGGPIRIWVDWKPELVRRNCPFFGYARNWALAESYAYALQDSQVTVSITFGPQLDGISQGWLDSISIEEVAQDFRPPGELVLDGGMENGAYPFLAGYGAREALTAGTAWLAVDRTEFLQGRCSLKMVNVGFSSNELLFHAGETYQISFWAKCSQPEELVRMTIGPAFATIPVKPPGHYYHGVTRVGSTEWKRFIFTLKIPANGDRDYYGEWAAWVLNLGATCPAWMDSLSVKRISPGQT